MRKLLCLALVLFAGVLGAATLKGKGKALSYESKGSVYAEGETFHLVSTREAAELTAIKDAIDRIAAVLEKKGLGSKRDIAQGVENAVLKETDLKALKLGKVKIESVYQERWEAPDGKDAWSVKVKISVALK
jgi:hypothetical protein